MRSFLILTLIIVVCAVANYQWQRLDTLPPHQDEARHLTASLRYLDDLQEPVKERLALFAFKRNESHPPLVYIITVPFYIAGGTDKSVASFVNILFMIIMVLSVYGIGKRLYNREDLGLLAAFLLVCYPIIVRLNRLYLPEIPETALVSLSIYLAVRAEGLRRGSWSLLLGLICGLGMLVKWHFVIFAVAPVIYILFSSSRKLFPHALPKNRLLNVALCIFGAVVVSAPWYIYNLNSGISPFKEAMVISPPIFSTASILFHPLALVDSMILVPMTVIFLIGLGLTLFFRKASPALLLWLGVPLIILTLLNQKLQLYYTPALPSVALLTVVGLLLIKNRGLRICLIGLALAASVLNFILTTSTIPLGEIDISYPLPISGYADHPSFGPRVGIFRSEALPYEPRQEDWKIETILKDITAFSSATYDAKVRLGWFIYPHQHFNRYCLLYYIELGIHPILLTKPEDAQIILTRSTTDDQRQELRDLCSPWLHLKQLKKYKLPDGSQAAIFRSGLTRRRHYEACELPLDVGEKRVEDSEAANGWARYADRERTPPGVILKGPSQMLEQGNYSAVVRLKYERPQRELVPVKIEILTSKVVEPLVSRDIKTDEMPEPGRFGNLRLDFHMPDRDLLELRFLHTGNADLWIDSIDIVPLTSQPDKSFQGRPKDTHP